MSAMKILPILGIVFILFGALWLLGGGSSVTNSVPGLGSKYSVACDVTVSNKLGSAPNIESFNCQKQNACLLSIASPDFMSFVPKNTVFVQSVAADGAKSSAVKLEITEQTLGSTAKTVEVKHCTSSSSGTIKLSDKNSVVLQTREWTVS